MARVLATLFLFLRREASPKNVWVYFSLLSCFRLQEICKYFSNITHYDHISLRFSNLALFEWLICVRFAVLHFSNIIISKIQLCNPCHQLTQNFTATMPNIHGTSHISTSERTFIDVLSIITVCVKEESPMQVILSNSWHV